MKRRTRGQLPLFPITTRPVPPALLFSADAATRSDQIRRIRSMRRSVDWARYCADNIDDWPEGAA